MHTWDVIVVPFPYADPLAEKRRPALVVSSPRLTAEHGLIWAAMITSAANAPWACDVTIPDFAAVGLPAPSKVRPAKLACLEPSRVIRVAGRLAAPEQKAVAARLSAFGWG